MCKVSVIVIAYNIENYIKKCLKTILTQSFKDIEIIVVNDGSTDNTLKEIKSTINNDSRAHVIDKKNGGAIEARKSGLGIAKGDYLLFVDGDDWLDIKAIEKLYKKAIEEKVDILLYNYYLSKGTSLIPCKSYTPQLHNENDNLKSSMLCYISPSLWTKFIKRDFILENGINFPNNISYGEDMASVISMFIYDPKISILEDYLYYYFQRDDSTTNKLDSRMLDIPKAVEFIRGILINHGIYQKYIHEFNYLAYTHIFYNKLICTNVYKEIHKEMFGIWKDQKINIKYNFYYRELKKNCTAGLAIKMKIFNFSYRMGLGYLYFRRMLGIQH